MTTCEDVLIVGAGPVGVFSALALAQVGVSVTLIDSEPKIMEAPRNAVVMPSTILIFQELGVLDDIEMEAISVDRLAIHFPGLNDKLILRYPPMFGHPLDRQLHIGQDIFTNIGLRHAQRLGVDVRFKTSLQSFEQDGGGVTAS